MLPCKEVIAQEIILYRIIKQVYVCEAIHVCICMSLLSACVYTGLACVHSFIVMTLYVCHCL